ncbi:MAG: HAD family phosphatase [Lachnospiraceae bacterium]|nr:HAD family phosphatase [Candidatus Equihabitans merdae]
MIKNIVFDMGKVLMSFGWRNVCKQYGLTEEATEIVHKEFKDLWQKALVDAIPYPEMHDEYLRRYPEHAEELHTYLTHVHEGMRALDYTHAWTKELKEQGYHLYVLSNWTRFNHERLVADGTFDYLENFDGQIWSYAVKQAKPDSAIYQTLLDRYDLIADECVYFDDVEENIAAGNQAGLHGVLFESFEQAKAALADLL